LVSQQERILKLTILSKGELRSQLAQQRHLFHQSADREHLAQQLKDVFSQHIFLKAPQVIVGYLPIHSEINPMALLSHLEKEDHHLGLPITKGNQLEFMAWAPGEPLIQGKFGVFEPVQKVPLTPTVILMPLLGFDKQGNRLGYGKGYYDKALAPLLLLAPVLKIGLAYDMQEVPFIPTDSHDQKLDWVITPTKAWRF